MRTKYDFFSEKDIARFNEKIDVGKPDECWDWNSSVDTYGYGSFRAGLISCISSRVAYYFAKGEIPKGLCVLHSCDRPICCNPAHLTAGTRKENALQMMARGRQNFQKHPETIGRGEKNAMAKFSDEVVKQVIATREANPKLQYWKIGKMFKMSREHVGQLVRGDRRGKKDSRLDPS